MLVALVSTSVKGSKLCPQVKESSPEARRKQQQFRPLLSNHRLRLQCFVHNKFVKFLNTLSAKIT